MSEVKNNIVSFLEKNLDDQFFLVDVKVSPGNKVTVYIDSEDALSIEACTKYTRMLLNDENMGHIFESHALEVSSPGLDQPFIHPRQYKKNIGRNLKILLNDGVRKKGALLEANGKEIKIAEIVKKKKAKDEMIETVIPMENIKKAKVEVSFK